MRVAILHLAVVYVLVGVLGACTPGVPSQYIQPDEMEDILYDYYIGQGMTYGPEQAGNADFQREVNYLSVLRKHGVTQAEFDSSLVYYYTRADRFVKMYDRVQKRLSDKALELGASVGEVERFATQSLTGDTADIWNGPRYILLLPQPPYHVAQFAQDGDTTFRKGDGFLLSFDTDYLVQSGSKNMTAYLAITYENDSVLSQYVNVFSQGNSSIRIPACDERVKEIKAFFYMPPRQEDAPANDMSLLFVDRIQLIRFHRRQEAVGGPGPGPSRPSARRAGPDSIVPASDTVRRHVRRLGERPIPMTR